MLIFEVRYCRTNYIIDMQVNQENKVHGWETGQGQNIPSNKH